MIKLLDSVHSQILDDFTSHLQSSLQDIVGKVKIESNFCISHPDYKPLKLPDQIVERLHQLPSDMQHKHLTQQLSNFLYGIYYNASLRSVLRPDSDSTSYLLLDQEPENKTFLGVDLEFYEQLHNSNSGTGYFDPGWSVVRQESDGQLAVLKQELTLHIERSRHLQLADQSAVVGQEVAIKMPQNFVQNGFYMAVGNAGPDDHRDPDGNSGTVRIYFNLTAEGAVALMANLTRRLNDLFIPFTFKALYNPEDYVRYDSAVLYFQKSNYLNVLPTLQAIYIEEKAHFKIEVPLFTKQLAPGLGLAEEPDQKFSTQESFGTNRCQIVANGLLDAWLAGDESSEGRMNKILQHFSLLGIDWQRAYLNASSEDIYTPLEV